MHKPMTQEELVTHDGISPEDKFLIEAAVGHTSFSMSLIEVAVGQHSDSSEADNRDIALRGYLVGLWDELVPDDKLREDLDLMAASWSDGWSYCLTYRTTQ